MAESLSFEGDLEMQRGPLGRVLFRVCQVFALAGGVLLLALINMSLISIIGRKLFATPIRGDIELMEIGASIAIATFLPLCELRGTHIKVDAFTMKMPDAVVRTLDAFAHLLCLLAALILAWRTRPADARQPGVRRRLHPAVDPHVDSADADRPQSGAAGAGQCLPHLHLSCSGRSRMSGLSLGLIALAITMTLLVLRVHIGITMLIGGAACFLAVNDGDFSRRCCSPSTTSPTRGSPTTTWR